MRPAPLWRVTTSIWCERWQPPDERLRAIETSLRAAGACVLRGGPHDRWDVEVRGGFLGAARMLMAVEEHGGGRQLVRLRSWPVIPVRGPILTLGLGAVALAAIHDRAWPAAAVLGLCALLPLLKGMEEAAAAMATVASSLRRLRERESGGA